MDSYKKAKGPWSDFKPPFLDLLCQRQIESVLKPADLDGGCLLCSEDEPHQCHRLLVAEYLREKWGDVEIVHL